jgi:hypothetical protein
MAEIMFKVTVIWRGNKFIVGMNTDASVKDLGDELQKLTDIKADTMRLIVPRFSNKSSKLLFPFSDEHSQLSLQEASIMEVSFSTLSLFLFFFFFFGGGGGIVITNMTNFPYTRYFVSVILLNFKHVWM